MDCPERRVDDAASVRAEAQRRTAKGGLLASRGMRRRRGRRPTAAVAAGGRGEAALRSVKPVEGAHGLGSNASTVCQMARRWCLSVTGGPTGSSTARVTGRVGSDRLRAGNQKRLRSTSSLGAPYSGAAMACPSSALAIHVSMNLGGHSWTTLAKPALASASLAWARAHSAV